jgi:hypothetical protein
MEGQVSATVTTCMPACMLAVHTVLYIDMLYIVGYIHICVIVWCSLRCVAGVL